MMMHRVLAESTSKEAIGLIFANQNIITGKKKRDPFHMDILTGI